MPKTITLKETRAAYSLSIEAGQANHGPIFVEHEGQPVAVIVSIEDYRQHFPGEPESWLQEQLQPWLDAPALKVIDQCTSRK